MKIAIVIAYVDNCLLNKRCCIKMAPVVYFKGTSPVKTGLFIFKNLIKLIMLDLKTFKSALEQLEEERKIPKEKILDAIEQAMAAAYKKDYGKKGQIIRAKFDLETGKTNFYQVKIVVDESIAILDGDKKHDEEYSVKDASDERVHFNAEHHIMLEDAKKIKKGVELNDEVIFPLETKEDYGRIA